jgi:putative endonuclease
MRDHGEHRYWVYILANAPRNFYVGFTGQLRKRVYEHKTKSVECVTDTWNECRLVYYEAWQDVHRAIRREKQIKPWRREKKIRLIESVNRNWHDLSDGWYPNLDKTKGKGGAPPLAARSAARSG